MVDHHSYSTNQFPDLWFERLLYILSLYGKLLLDYKPHSLRTLAIYGQESNYTTWRLAMMNLAIRGIDAQIGHGDTFHKDCNPDLKADYVLANPPFNDSDWRGELLKGDKRWKYGAPPAGNAQLRLGSALHTPSRPYRPCWFCSC